MLEKFWGRRVRKARKTGREFPSQRLSDMPWRHLISGNRALESSDVRQEGLLNIPLYSENVKNVQVRAAPQRVSRNVPHLCILRGCQMFINRDIPVPMAPSGPALTDVEASASATKGQAF